MGDKLPVICLMGTTATGKTDIAVALARTGRYEIISVDSAMVYRGMDIGTAKPDAATLAVAPHHLVDIRDPLETYSVAAFRTDALKLIQQIHARGRIPLLVGGTMLYFRALLQGIAELPQADAGIRAEIEADARKHGWEALHAELAGVDPEAARRIHPNDPQRLQRALEVYRITGTPMTQLQQSQTRSPLPFKAWKFALVPEDRSWLHQRIAQRFQHMLERGFVEEVRGFFHQENMHPALPSMRSVGYRQVWQYLAGELTYEEMVERGIIATRQLAKRQITWMRSEDDLVVFDPRTLRQEEIISTLESATKRMNVL